MIDEHFRRSLERGEAQVEGEPDPAALVRAVEEEGYQAQVVP